jgi:PAS domain S-box-containing protein
MKIAEPGSDLARLQQLVDSLPAFIFTNRPDGYLDYCNQRMLEYLGLPFEALEGWKWGAVVHPDDVAEVTARWQASVASGEPFECEARMRRADGAYRWMLHREVPVRDESGQIVRWYGSGIDIDDRKRAESKINEQQSEIGHEIEERQRAEFYLAEGERLAHMGSWVFNPAGVFDYWSRELFQIYGLDPAKGAPSLQEYLARIHPQDREFMASLITQMVAETSGCDVTKRIVRPDGETRHVRCVGTPVVENGTLQRIVGTAMDVTEHELLTQEIRRREAYLAEAQRLSHTGSFGWRPDDGEVVWSDETCRIFEYDRTVTPTVESVMERVHPEDRAAFQEVINRASAGATHFEHAYRLLLPDGRVKHVHALARRMADPTESHEFVGAITDVTEHKLAEGALRESEENFRLVVHGIAGLVATLTPAGDVDFVNRQVFEYFGKTIEELKNWQISDAVHPDDHDRVVALWAHTITNGQPYDVEYRLRRSDGMYRWFHVRGRPLRDAKGAIARWYVLLTDIDERKQAEQRLKEQEAEFRQMLDLSPQLAAVFGPARERLYANRTALEYLGISLDEWRQRAPGFAIHAEDVDRLYAYADRASSIGSAYEVEIRIRKRDGSYRWFQVRFNPVRDDKGQITRWYWACTDIEDRKRAQERLEQENVALREEIDKASMFEEIVGASPALKKVLTRVSKVAASDSTVLINGETGTGKELVARAIHRRSSRSPRAFVAVNCAAIPRDLIASELFGHEKGAFTGAVQRRLGRFELADGGTIFLDEVGELSPDTQVALLRVLQEREFERVGGRQPIHVDVRVIAATNRDLNAAVASGTFRQDLFYRLNVFPLEMPPLRERREDIPVLVEYFIDRYARRAGKEIRRANVRTLDQLQSYPWPGNVRELQNVIERSVIVCDTDEFTVDESWLSAGPAVESRLALSSTVAAHEKATIEEALRASGGRVFGPSGAAARLGIARSTLESKIRALGINKNRFRGRPAK